VKHSPRRLIEGVGYITAPGERVSTIVTSETVFARRDGDFVLTHPLPGATVESVRARTGFGFATGADLAPEPESSPADLALPQPFDPKPVFLPRSGS
jgi:acyl CoA:acetate/3-ketoacid CoA transferase beta subunit